MPLNEQQKEAVALDAGGFKAPEIALVIGVEADTIKRWRRDDEYKAAVEQIRAAQLAAVDDLIKRFRTLILESGIKAIQTLNDNMDATNKSGTPNRGIQIEAARTLLQHLKFATADAFVAEEEKKSNQPAQAAVLVINNVGDEPERKPDVVEAAGVREISAET